MRKIVFFWIVFFATFSYAFAGENTIEFGNISFDRKLFIFQNNNQNMDFVALNPMFFDNGNKYFSMYLIRNISLIGRFQNTQMIYPNSQENIFTMLSALILWTGAIYVGSSMMNRQEREIYNDRWEQQAILKYLK